MKQKITFLLAAILLLTTGLTLAQTRDEVVAYTLDGTVTGGSNGYATESEITQGDLTWMVTGNTTMNPWRIGGKSLTEVDRPLYSTGTISDDITKVVVTNGTAANVTVNSMTLIVSPNADFSSPTSTVTGEFVASGETTFNRPTGADWSNKYFKLVYNLTISATSNKFVQFISADFYKDNGGSQTQTVATPTFSPAAGTYTEAQSVTISCATDGATIYYTTDGTDPVVAATGINGTEYTTAIAISETTTVKAIAVKDGYTNSAIASATYTIEAGPTLVTIAEARAMALNEYALVQGVITFIDAKNVYVQDETAGIDLYLNSTVSTLNLGDKVQAYGKIANYKGLIELSGINPSEASQFSVISTGNTLPLAVKTIEEINTDAAGSNMLQSTRVQIVEATVGTINTSNNTPITQGENSLNIYKMPTVEGLVEGDVITVIGIIGCYNAPQLRVASADDVTIHQQQQETVATPTFSPAAGTYTEAQSVTISCATDGATIYYTTDGTDPVVAATGINGTQYNPGSVINISETTTVKAIAVKDGYTNSAIASATYTIEAGPTLVTIAEARALANDEYALVQGIVTFIDGRNVYVQDESAGIDLYLNSNTVPSGLAIGDKVQAYGKKTVYKGLIELTAINGSASDQFSVISTGNTLPLAVKTIEEINADAAESNMLQSTRVQIVEATVGTINTSNNTPITQGENSLNIYKMPTVEGLAQGDVITVIGVIGCFNAPQLRVASADDVTIQAPTYYNVTIAQVTNGTVEVSATQAEEGDTIYVTATPANNYELTSLTYSYTGTTPVSIMETMQFIMPAADVTVEATFTALQTVVTPTFTPVAGSYIQAQEMTMTCATEGATIYYTLDGNDPTANSSVYSEAITISETTTVKAMAVKEGMIDSEIATAEYTIVEPMTIAEAKVLANNEYALVQGVVTFIDGRNVYVQDATAGIDLYLNSNTVPEALAIGDEVLAYGKKTVYNGLVELTGIAGGNANQFVILSNGNELPLAEKTIAEIMEDYQSGANMLQSTRVQIVDATIGAINNNGNTPVTQGENTMNIYKMPVVEGLEQGDYVTVIGIIGCYNTPQLRVNSAEDVTFTHPAGIFVNPSSLAGFNYAYEEGPSTVKSFTITGRSISAPTHIVAPEYFEMSSFPGETFVPESQININTYTGAFSYTIKVRLKAGLEIGAYEDNITIYQDEVDTLYVALSGTVTEQSQSGADYVRITDLSQIGNGAKVIFAARYNETANEYFAMTAQASGKPEGVLFNSVAGTGQETLPSTITDEESTYYWTVETDGTNYTFTNANGDVLGYTSSTNFATGGDNVNWTIAPGTSEATAMVPEYSAFVITNANVTVRAFALNGNHNYGPYHTQNMAAENYNFFIDIFATTGGTGTLVCATPTFSPAAGTYYEEQEITINCTTTDATIYYTLDGSDPTVNSTVYTEPFVLQDNTTVKAIAMKEGYDDSEIAEAVYVFMLDAVTIFNQDWEGDMNGWTFVTVEGSKPWTIAQYNGNHYANANGYNGGVNEQWCISPAFSLEQYSDVSLTFVNAKNYTGPDLQLFFSNDYDGSDPTTANWTELTFEMSTGSYAWTESGVIEFTGFAGDECYIGFKYTSTETEAAAWEVDDILLIGFTSDPVLTVTPLSLSFSYIEGNGPSVEQTFVVSGFNLTENVVLTIAGEDFEMSETTGEDFDPMEEYEIVPFEGAIEEIIYVRLAEGLEMGDYTSTITVASELDDITVTLNGTVNEPIQGGDWNRIGSLADLNDGDQLVIASRYDATVGDGYYAMTAEVSGKPDGVLFTSVNNAGVEVLPDEIVADITTFVWNVTLNDTIIMLVNANGDTLGYSSSTNFAGNTNTDWAITYGTSGENAMVPNYSGFIITNGTTTNRGIAKNANNKFGAYSTSNMNNADYNFYLDLFVLGGTATQTVATPVFSMSSGTYYEEIDVEITCTTEGATIYYTNDGTEPTSESMVYEGPIHVDADMTLKAIAMLEGYENSGIATANYVIITGLTIILNQDWEGEMNGWSFVTVEGNKPWNVSSYGGNHYAYANGYNDDVDNDQWCISPAFDLTNMTNVVLTFRNAKNYSGPDLELFFADDYDGQDPSSATWHDLQFTMSAGSYEWTESGEISLDAFRGDNCYIAFHYISTVDEGAAAWEVDDILITGTVYDAVEETELTNVNLWNHNDEIIVENNTNGNLQLVVFNILGQPVHNQTIGTGSVRFSYNLAKGVYVVTLQNNKEHMAVKMIVK